MINYSHGSGPISDPSASNISVAMLFDTPSSRGSLQIVSKDPSVKPKVDMKWMTSKVDMEFMKLGLEGAEGLIKGSGKEGFGELVEKEVGSTQEVDWEKAEAVERCIREGVETGAHSVRVPSFPFSHRLTSKRSLGPALWDLLATQWQSSIPNAVCTE